MTETASHLLKVPEAAEALGVCQTTIYHWVRSGALPAVQHGPGYSIRIDSRDLLRTERRGEEEQ
jgi:excisionase family DNA binding protein